MKILMMVLILSGCQVDDYANYDDVDAGDNSEAVKESPAYHCSDLTEYREVIETASTTYQLTKNDCNTVSEVVFRPDGTMASVRKDIGLYDGYEQAVITYSFTGFYYRDRTIGRRNANATQQIDYDYVNDSDFITMTLRPSYVIKYIYNDDPKFKRIMDEALYSNVIAEVNDAIR